MEKSDLMKFNFEHGEILLIDKDINWTSFDVVNKMRNLIKKTHNLNKIKVGHAGTLDPLASGLLIVCTGKSTKLISQFQNQEKEYTGNLFLGATTPSYDKETEIDKKYPTEHITDELIHVATQKFIGLVEQIPPLFSAVNVKGVRAYEFARNKKQIKLEPRKVNIKSFKIENIEMPVLNFNVVCSKGTYIRSLVRDFGKSLDTGAYLTSLRRIRIGESKVKDAINIKQFEYLLEKNL